MRGGRVKKASRINKSITFLFLLLRQFFFSFSSSVRRSVFGIVVRHKIKIKRLNARMRSSVLLCDFHWFAYFSFSFVFFLLISIDSGIEFSVDSDVFPWVFRIFIFFSQRNKRRSEKNGFFTNR